MLHVNGKNVMLLDETVFEYMESNYPDYDCISVDEKNKRAYYDNGIERLVIDWLDYSY